MSAMLPCFAHLIESASSCDMFLEQTAANHFSQNSFESNLQVFPLTLEQAFKLKLESIGFSLSNVLQTSENDLL